MTSEELERYVREIRNAQAMVDRAIQLLEKIVAPKGMVRRKRVVRMSAGEGKLNPQRPGSFPRRIG
jgi:hypothetical protein